MEKIAIVTVDYNGHEDTLSLLKSARKLDADNFCLKWFLVDNGSDTPLEDRKPEKIIDNIEVLQTGVNKGYAGGYNFGMKYAINWGADYILLINNDTLIGDGGLLKKLKKVMDADEKIGMVSPKIYFAPGYEFYKERYKSRDQGKVIWYAGGYFDKKNALVVHRGIDEVDGGAFDKIEEIDFISGCCLLIRSSLLEEIGFFEEKLFAYFEDVDFVIRAQKAHYKMYYCGNTYLFHKVSRTAGIGSPLTDYLLTRNRLYIGMKYLSLRTKLALAKEALRLLFTGRLPQKEAIKDYCRQKFGAPPGSAKEEKEKKYPLKLSIVIVNYKTPDLTKKLLETILNRESGYDHKKGEIIVLDNGSNDKTTKVIPERFPEVKFIKNRENMGFAKGYNKAINFSKGEFILMLNSDIEVLPKSISSLLSEAEKRKDSILVGKLLLSDGSTQNSCFKLPTITGAIKEYFLKQPEAYRMYYPKGNTPTIVEGAVMANYLIPRSVWNKVGELSEESFLYFEDIEYCRRLKKAGIKIYYCPNVKFIHHHGASSKKIGKQSYEYLKKGAMLYHGRIKYLILCFILWLGQKISPSQKTP